MDVVLQSHYLAEREIPSGEIVEIHRCPYCAGVFGIDWTFVDQVKETVNCMYCSRPVNIQEPIR